MDDTLYLLISYICSAKILHKVAVGIPGGMNTSLGEEYKYFKEEDVHKKLIHCLPLHIATHVDSIVAIDQIFNVYLIPVEKVKGL